MSEPKMTAESLLGPVAEGDVVLDAAHFMGVLRSAAGSLLKYERYATLHGAPTYVADASACRVFVDRGRALRVIERVLARVAELERERDEARERCAIAEDLLRRVVIHGGSGSLSWREMGDWCCDYAGFMRGLGELNHKRSHAHCLHRETPGTADGAIGAGASEAPVHHLYGSRGLWARAEKAEARVAELEAILHDAPTIAEVETHAPGWLGCVRAALGKEAQP